VNDRFLPICLVVLCACSLDVTNKISCRTTDDCGGGNVCVSSRCVPRDDGGPVDGDASTMGDSREMASPADEPDATEVTEPPTDGPTAISDGPAERSDGPALISQPQAVLWLDAAKGFSVTGSPPGALWLDQSGNDNHARQDIAASIPAFTPDAAGGLPAITFRGQTTFLKVDDSPSLRFGTGDYAAAVVARSNNPSGETFPLFFEKVDSADHGPALYLHAFIEKPGGQAGAGDDLNVAVTSSRRYNDGQLHLFLMRRAGTIMSLRIDGETIGWVAESPPFNLDAPGTPLLIGGTGAVANFGGQTLAGDIAELIAMRGPVGDEQLLALEAALMEKYGLRPAAAPPPLPPSAADGLVLWLDPASGVTTGPSSFAWRDRSGMGNDAIAPPGAGLPQLVQAWPDTPPAVQLSGDNQCLRLPQGMSDFTLGMSAFIVVEPQAPLAASRDGAVDGTRFFDFASPPGAPWDENDILIQRDGIQGNELAYITCDSGSCYGAGQATDIVHSYERQLLEVQAPGGAPGANNIFLLFKNGVTAGYGYGKVPPIVTRESVLIGRSNLLTNGQPDPPDLRGYLGEIVLYNRLLREDERRGVERYLLDRWKLPAP